MKKYACLLVFALLLNGCDDGDLTVDTIDFDDPTISSQTCNTLTNSLVYRLKSQESLLIQLPDNMIINDVTLPGAPVIYNIDNNLYRVVYRAYNGKVETANICGTIPPTSPSVTEEWQAKAGKIVISTTQNEVIDDATGSSKITGYTHNIVFNNITFAKPSGIDQVNDVFDFGNFVTTVTPVVVDFSAQTAQYCPDQKKVYIENTTSSLVLENLSDNIIVNVDTPTGEPRESAINLNSFNKLYYRTYAGVLPVDASTYFCNSQTPASPAVLDTWFGKDGLADVSGIIQVTTTHSLKVYKHTIVLKKATLQKGNTTFKLGDNFVLGTVTIILP
ncbi:hypothetical protein NJT12_09105 [Flavobacterium sp. AC]|uniref:Lipoprotein n=1 Tax=Flavobacterium azizsancarii TaxID=2961580 RepID=A0ABT4WCB5_9FLAO|nr:hypothetical protein [Flavobacterium azizsancarii]MDA6069775.1 hypothetical protein [Flavobacterium azizsancarii]